MLVDGDLGYLEKLGDLLQGGGDAFLGNEILDKIDNVELLLCEIQGLRPKFFKDLLTSTLNF